LSQPKTVAKQLEEAAVGALPPNPTIENLPKVTWKNRRFVQQAGDQLTSITHLVDKRSTSEPCERARPIKHTVPPLLQLNQHPRLS
jgi:hypothetical protein